MKLLGFISRYCKQVFLSIGGKMRDLSIRRSRESKYWIIECANPGIRLFTLDVLDIFWLF